MSDVIDLPDPNGNRKSTSNADLISALPPNLLPADGRYGHNNPDWRPFVNKLAELPPEGLAKANVTLGFTFQPPAPSNILNIMGPNNKVLITIENDGRTTIHDPELVDEAARRFWDAVYRHRPKCSCFTQLTKATVKPARVPLGVGGYVVPKEARKSYIDKGFPYGYMLECPTCHEPTIKLETGT